jgi:putative SOS response-associated peptidase YedK
MCGRYVIYGPQSRNNREIDFLQLKLDFPPHYNAAPTQRLPVYRWVPERGPELGLLRWGLIPHWAKDPAVGARLINARGDTLAEKPAFRAAFRRRRCLVPMVGFYEWKGEAGRKQPYFVRRSDGELFAVAGLHEAWTSPQGETVETFTIVTTDANAAMEPIHNRMPAIVAPRDFEKWLGQTNAETPDPATLLRPYDGSDLEVFPVSTRVNAVRNDDEGLIEPLPAVD